MGNCLESCYGAPDRVEGDGNAEILISVAKAGKPLGIAADVRHMIEYARESRIGVRTVLVNDSDLSKYEDTTIYADLNDFRKTFVDFLRNSAADHLIFYYSGHGSSAWLDNKSVEFLVLTNNTPDWYSDVVFTEDIDRNLPKGKRLYLIIDACHSGGMINFWHLDVRLKKDIVLLAGSNAEINSWDDPGLLSSGGLYTNSFIKYATRGRILYQIAQDILEDLFDSDSDVSPIISYGRPNLCVTRFCETVISQPRRTT